MKPTELNVELLIEEQVLPCSDCDSTTGIRIKGGEYVYNIWCPCLSHKSPAILQGDTVEEAIYNWNAWNHDI